MFPVSLHAGRRCQRTRCEPDTAPEANRTGMPSCGHASEPVHWPHPPAWTERACRLSSGAGLPAMLADHRLPPVKPHPPFPACFQVTHLKILLSRRFHAGSHRIPVHRRAHTPRRRAKAAAFMLSGHRKWKVPAPPPSMPHLAYGQDPQGARPVLERNPPGRRTARREQKRTNHETASFRNPTHHSLLAFR